MRVWILLLLVSNAATADCRSAISAGDLQPIGDKLNLEMGEVLSISAGYMPASNAPPVSGFADGTQQLLVSIDRATQQQAAGKVVLGAITVYRQMSDLLGLVLLRDFMINKKDKIAVVRVLELSLKDVSNNAASAKTALLKESSEYENPALSTEAVDVMRTYDQIVALGDTCNP